MLIELDESLLEITTQDMTGPIISTFRKLAMFKEECYHIITAKKIDILEHVMKLMEKHDQCTEKTYLEIIQNDYPDYGGLLDEVKYKVLISKNIREFQIITSEDVTVYVVPVDKFSRMFAMAKTCLLSENINDCKLYVQITKEHYKNEEKACMAYNIQNGGGSTCANVLESILQEQQDKKFCLTFADTDKKHPNDSFGRTLSDLIAIHKQYSNYNVSKLFYLKNFHEKENLIPPSVYGLCSSTNCNLEKILKIEQEHSTHHEKLQYFDIKEGLTVALYKREAVKNYFDGLLNDLGIDTTNILQRNDNYRIIPGIGDCTPLVLEDIFENGLEEKLKLKTKELQVEPDNVRVSVIISKIKDNISKRLDFYDNLPEYIKTAWIKVSEAVFSWCCCPLDVETSHLIQL
ncbi:hypothetical protein [Methanococcus maripaludis]|uniref:Uncharacterized protein n=1 Tax=Methanococcus maripaludis TaxID=39152 RepID=A0A7J9PW83_METMI|nr:hypothetical protein [Methanococcus maripaludis]MBA2868940.1 hypothetical protein [Methanococcus maripaludis]